MSADSSATGGHIEAYHVAFVVTDLDAAMAEFSDLLGLQWASVQVRDLAVRTPESRQDVALRFVYSSPVSGPCLIELIEGQADTVFSVPDGHGWAFHHLGLWAPDLAEQSTRLATAGAPLVATLGAGPEAAGFACHQLQHGPQIELLDAARRPGLMGWLAGAPSID
ncbi:VOC family protein [Euzebya tangerina]|uniref:VOC family protein n=1 Tax=Euzebya tangerina TaxID=591198 RepID=UPI000E30FBFF|nr:VOC family protein [Euzebya tangerina]